MKNNKKKKILIIFVGVIVLLGIIVMIFINKIFNRVTYSPTISSNSRNEKWIEDIEFLKKELPKKHKNLFFYKSKEEFNEDMDRLVKNISNYTDQEIKGEIVRIIVSINDSHTSVSFNYSKVYPVKFFEFEDGIYLIDGSLKYKDYWGKKLLAINGYTVEEGKEMLRPYIAKDNESMIKNEFTKAIKSFNLLAFSGITDSEEITYTFTDGQITVKPLSYKEINNTQFISECYLIDDFPISQQKAHDKYWFEYMKNENVVYIKYNACSNMERYSFKEFTQEVFKEVDKNNPDKLIIDLRDNGGGNSMIFNSFFKAIKERKDINKEGRIYVIIGRKTFSSAVLNTMKLRNKTNAILVGEATAGQPNSFGEVKEIYLSNTNTHVYYSSSYFKTTNEVIDSIYPDKEIILKSSSFFEGKDDFLEDIIHS